MYGVVIEKGPKNWQIIQQKDGFAEIEVEGRVECEDSVWADYNDHKVVLRIVDEETNGRVCELFYVKPENKRFKATLKIPTGGPYRLDSYFRFNGNWERKGSTVLHLGVGDVYVITGQSNAEGSSKDCAYDPPSQSVHALRLNGEWDMATHPLNDTTDCIFPIYEEGPRSGTGPWINFGKILAKKLGYPIGLIPAAKGGAPLSYWNKREDGQCFDNMLEMMKYADTDVKGIVWYQGCSDTDTEEKRSTYLERFKTLYADFESVFFKDIPIITVQLNRFVSTKDADTEEIGKNYAAIREAQRQAAKQMENVYMVPAIDLPLCDGIHNTCAASMVVGERVANMALRYIYGKTVICDAPDIEKAIKVEGNKVRLYFKNVYDGIFADLNTVDNLMFSVTDDNGRMVPCDYECPCDNTILLHFDRDILENAVVNCDGYNDTGLMPYDLFSYLPVVPFNGVKIE